MHWWLFGDFGPGDAVEWQAGSEDAPITRISWPLRGDEDLVPWDDLEVDPSDLEPRQVTFQLTSR
jgi:hypothetical protein